MILRNKTPRESEQLRNFLYQSLRQFPNLFTEFIYAPDEKEQIIHNPNTSDEYSTDTKVVGPDSYFSEIPDKEILESLLGTSDISKINQVFQWINNTRGYLWRINDKPQKKKLKELSVSTPTTAGFSSSAAGILTSCFLLFGY